jgi:pyruvate/2-oxoglutarate dehydrogenase complex dihydrolipoamide acyltransferase (E2) component
LWSQFASGGVLRAQAVTFLKRIKEVVEDPRRLLLEV